MCPGVGAGSYNWSPHYMGQGLTISHMLQLHSTVQKVGISNLPALWALWTSRPSLAWALGHRPVTLLASRQPSLRKNWLSMRTSYKQWEWFCWSELSIGQGQAGFFQIKCYLHVLNMTLTVYFTSTCSFWGHRGQKAFSLEMSRTWLSTSGFKNTPSTWNTIHGYH